MYHKGLNLRSGITDANCGSLRQVPDLHDFTQASLLVHVTWLQQLYSPRSGMTPPKLHRWSRLSAMRRHDQVTPVPVSRTLRGPYSVDEKTGTRIESQTLDCVKYFWNIPKPKRRLEII